jgi:hypothetical protein
MPPQQSADPGLAMTPMSQIFVACVMRENVFWSCICFTCYFKNSLLRLCQYIDPFTPYNNSIGFPFFRSIGHFAILHPTSQFTGHHHELCSGHCHSAPSG